MTTISCEEWTRNAGWRCTPMPNGQDLYIVTPLTMSDGKPLDFYLAKTDYGYEVDDDGMTLFALRGLGFGIDDRRNWRGLEGLATNFGFQLTAQGVLRGHALANELPQLNARVLQLFAGITAWEAERFRDFDSDMSLTNEVERVLREKDGARLLARNVTVPAGRTEVTFDFQWGDTFVDAISPTAQAVASRLRKAIMIGAADNEQIHVLFVIDDRFDRDKATREMAVLAHIARAVRYTDFARIS